MRRICANCGRKIPRNEEPWNSWDPKYQRNVYYCNECETYIRQRQNNHAHGIFTRGVFLAVCGVIVIGALLLLAWSARQGPPAECYSFTNIKAEPWHKVVFIPPLLIIGVATLRITSKKLPS